MPRILEVLLYISIHAYLVHALTFTVRLTEATYTVTGTVSFIQGPSILTHSNTTCNRHEQGNLRKWRNGYSHHDSSQIHVNASSDNSPMNLLPWNLQDLTRHWEQVGLRTCPSVQISVLHTHLHRQLPHSHLHSHMYRLIHCVSLHSDMSEGTLQTVRRN